MKLNDLISGALCADATNWGSGAPEAAKAAFRSFQDRLQATRNLEKVVVTRHSALVEYLTEMELVTSDVPVLAHASAADVAGKHVIGVLPNYLASQAALVTEIPLNVPAELRGVELTLEQVRQYAGAPRTYLIQEVEL